MDTTAHLSLSPQPELLARIIDFLASTGIQFTLTSENFTAFLDGVKIKDGELLINPANLLCVGDVLHEAGHLACVPAALRPQVNENVADSVGEEHTYELGVIAWSVAAAHHLGIPLTEVFNEKAYKGQADWLLAEYSSGNYLGLPLLQWMGMTALPAELRNEGVAPYPAMQRWTRE
ncbi:hypothetical protein QWY85_03920 [Neolewinella lacunae]|uniref:Uncharacterized protein n=1 Tax=Neolewinella lacunae TaxID=1517758 RepID=A0A923T5Y9_9BACT|nr:hypothetical protein [Neolewinella lacunae]MBC6992845.1 hypothetical protein [Neolewinella lacunae]MDN3633791.1 hypothetical protein [Neolewinella lacunae]